MRLRIFWLLGLGFFLLGCGTIAVRAPQAVQAVQGPPPSRRAVVPARAAYYFEAPVYYQRAVVVLMFHAFGPRNVYDTITPGRFAGELRALQKDHFNVIPASLLDSFLTDRAQVPPNAVVLTMDDGYEGVYRDAFPVLQRFHDPATLFIVTGWIGRKPGILAWPELDTLARSPLITIGGHTYDLHGPIQTGPHSSGPSTVSRAYDPRTGRVEDEAAYEARVLGDLERAQRVLTSRYQRPVTDFAFPFGRSTPTLVRLLNQAGYRYLYTTRGWVNRAGEDPSRIYRLNVGNYRVDPANLIPTVRAMGAES